LKPGFNATAFYTLLVGNLMTGLLDPQQGKTVYDSTCGSNGLLIKWNLRLVEKFTTENMESKENIEKSSIINNHKQILMEATDWNGFVINVHVSNPCGSVP